MSATRVGLRDVAQRAGVSMGAVSHYLNHPERVAAATAVRIREAIEALGYVPNIAGRHLRRGVSDVIGFIAPDFGNPHFVDLAAAVEASAAGRGIRAFLANSRGDRDRENDYLALFEEYKVRGIVVASHQPIEDRLAAVRRRGTPSVLVGQRAASPDQMWVSIDDVDGGRRVGAHLVELGRRRIAFIGGPLQVPQVAARLQGLRQAAGEVEVVDVDERTVASGRAAARMLLERPAADRPDAVACVNDLVALGVLQTATALGVRVPEDLAIAGYDDTVFAEASLVPLTTVGQNHEEVARAVIEALTDVIDGERRARGAFLAAPRLVVRESTVGRI
jgi:LacI family transcriptional regulator